LLLNRKTIYLAFWFYGQINDPELALNLYLLPKRKFLTSLDARDGLFPNTNKARRSRLMPNTPQDQLVEPLLKSLHLMASLVEARDPYTGGHLWRVSQFSRLLAKDIGLKESDISRITLGGFLHDLGKIGIPDAILNKPDKLTEEEFAIIQTHPEVGARLLLGHPLGALVRAAVTMHHETPDGRGYPRGLVGSAIPLDAKIIGITDAFDAMTSTRPYRRGMTIEKALSIIEENLDRQFDRELGTKFLHLGKQGLLESIVGHSDFGIPVFECSGCGPTIVVRRSQKSGDLTHCRCCGGQGTIEKKGNSFSIAPNGKRGNAQQLEPDIDELLIQELVSEASKHLGNVAIPSAPLSWLRSIFHRT
jgi:hypothetical protein